jgi:hypothetical protein
MSYGRLPPDEDIRQRKIVVAYSQQKLKDRFLIGRNWKQVPIRNDIVRRKYWVYNTEINQTVEEDECGVPIFFIKFNSLPSDEVAETLEWRSIDCLHFAKRYSGCCDENANLDLQRSILKRELDMVLLEKCADQYGDEEIIELVKSIRVLYNILYPNNN